MTLEEKLSVRLGTGEDGEGAAAAAALLAEAEAFARDYCHMRPGEIVPEGLLLRIAEEDYARQDGAGVSSRSVSGASEYYRSHYSDGVLAWLRALRHMAGGRSE